MRFGDQETLCKILCAKIHGNMDVGRGKGGLVPLWILKISAKLVLFFVSVGKKQISPLLAPPPWKSFGKVSWWIPWKKSFRRPCLGNDMFA